MSDTTIERGLFIALEGPEGAGKSVQARLLGEALDALVTREPGGSKYGRRIRELVLDPDLDFQPTTELMLMTADRAEQFQTLVLPTVKSGRHVVTDRSAWSAVAYQGYGRKLNVDEVIHLSNFAYGGNLRSAPDGMFCVGLWPDLAILIDVPEGETSKRLTKRNADLVVDRIESAEAEFHERVRKGFHQLVERYPHQWAVVDGSGTIEDVQWRIWITILEHFPHIMRAAS